MEIKIFRSHVNSGILSTLSVSITVSIKVKEVLKLIDKTVKYGLTQSRSHTFNILIKSGLEKRSCIGIKFIVELKNKLEKV
ncbi:MAG: hypothetical protein B6U89_07595 [Desulfurococcales archaeon ex4484_58]|nr:MAG: hypothetical protein B6U89_07595 [Desulfurococcales archaeon ex4484_58]